MEVVMTALTPYIYRSSVVNPWTFFREIEHELDRVLGDLASEVSAGYPPLDVWYSETEALVRVELPGVKREDIEVEVTGNSLALKGMRRSPNQNGAKMIRQECPEGSFGRSLQMPFEIDSERVEAAFKDGVLELKLPRRREDVPKKLEIKVN